MNRAHLAFCALALLTATYLAADAAPPVNKSPVVFEYAVLTSLSGEAKIMWIFPGEQNIDEGTSIPKALNIAGKAGWELVAINSGAPDMTTYFFKRPK